MLTISAVQNERESKRCEHNDTPSRLNHSTRDYPLLRIFGHRSADVEIAVRSPSEIIQQKRSPPEINLKIAVHSERQQLVPIGLRALA